MRKILKNSLKLTMKKQAKIITAMEYGLVGIVILLFIMAFISRGRLSLK